jgi:hypothetical protein
VSLSLKYTSVVRPDFVRNITNDCQAQAVPRTELLILQHQSEKPIFSLLQMEHQHKRWCICEIYNCVNGKDEDPNTHHCIRGRLLPPSTVAQHHQDDKIWRAGQKNRDLESAFLATILPSSNSEGNDVVSARVDCSEALNHSYEGKSLILRDSARNSNGPTGTKPSVPDEHDTHSKRPIPAIRGEPHYLSPSV